ncbi:MAG: DUF3887 domain-containing protein [Bacteroidota bacterium]
MKFFCYLFLFSFTSALLRSQTNQELSVSLIQKMQRAQYDSCRVMFDSSVSNEINPEMLRKIWEGIPRYLGEFQSYSDIRTQQKDSLEIVSVRCAFVKTKLDLQLSYNAAHKIVGIFFVPPKNTTAYNYPEYYNSSKFYESKVTLKSGDYNLPAAICIPNNVKNPPVVVLVAGSGPNDKDETIGPNKILKDIAVGLASSGIASIRYDKRTLTYKNEMATTINKVGINEEVIEDAVNAAKLMKKNPVTKDSKLFIIGHSLGAMCTPLIATKCKPSGIILLAGNARPLEDLILEQYAYLLSVDTLQQEQKKFMDDLRADLKMVKDPKLLKTAKPEQLPLDLPSFYWQSLSKYKQVEVAKKLKQPILVLQGERDYQVTMRDYALWKEQLGADPKNNFISYPGLNHLFMKGEGKSLPAEYEKQGNMDGKVITDMIDWIKAH